MTWPLVPVDGRRGDSHRLLAQAVNYLLRNSGAMGTASTANSSDVALGSSEVFTGTWEENALDHVGFNVKADQDGTLTVEFSPDGGDTVTFSRDYPVYADRGFFRTLVKGAGRSFRATFTNGATAQTSFLLHSFYGDNLFPFSSTQDGEVLTTVSEQEENVFVAYASGDVTADTYAILIDLSDTTNFPHAFTGRVDVSTMYLQADRDSTAEGFARVGVITRVDGTDADIEYVQGITFTKSDDRHIIRDRVFSPSQLKLGVVSGELAQVATGFSETTASVNTGVTLNTPKGTATPAVGDVIMKFGRTAGTFSATVSCFYHGEELAVD